MTAKALLTASAVPALFSNVLTQIKAAAGTVETDVEAKFEAIINDAKATVETTLSAVAPDLDKDIGPWKPRWSAAADAFIAARAGPVVETAAAPEVLTLVASTATTLKAQVDAWAAKYQAPAVSPATGQPQLTPPAADTDGSGES